MVDEPETSEFGRGVVVCLAKFSEHLWSGGPYSEQSIREYARDRSDAQRERLEAEARIHPMGDSAQTLARVSVLEIGEGVRGSREATISSAIEMWASGASDHFYDLDHERAPEPLRELAELTLAMGHGFTGRTWALADLDRVRELWKESCLALDRTLGSEPDWGEW